jgi:hypothetical protein
MPKIEEEYKTTANFDSEMLEILDNFAKEIGLEGFKGNVKATLKAFIQKARENMEKGIESTTQIREPFEKDLNQDDFGAFACAFRKADDATTYLCFSRNPMVRVPHDGVIPKDICRLCERLQIRERFFTQPTTTKSGQVFKQYLTDEEERKRREKLEYFRNKEAIKTEATKERKKIREQDRRAKVNWDENDPNGVGFDSSELGDGYF